MIDLISLYMMQQNLGGSSSEGEDDENRVSKEDISTTIVEETSSFVNSYVSTNPVFPNEDVTYHNDIAFGNGVYVLANSKGSYYSFDCTNWSLIKNGSGEDFPLHGIIFTGSIFVGHHVDEQVSYLYTSADGIDWEYSGQFKYSDSGITTWESIIDFTCDSDGTIYAISSFNIVKGVGTVSYTWTALNASLKGDGTFKKIICENGKLLAIDTENHSYYSSNKGSTWTTGTIGSDGETNQCIGYDGTQFLAACRRAGMGVLFTSTNGTAWTETYTMLPSYVGSIAYGNGMVEYGSRNYVIIFDGKSFISLYTGSSKGISKKGYITTITEKTEILSPTILKKSLQVGETKVSFTNENIKTDSLLTFYTSKHTLVPSQVSVIDGKVELTYSSQTEDITVTLKIEG